MLLFARDIADKNHVHAHEDRDAGLKAYMDYQRKLYPYTIFRAGLDLAYKELDDILNYADNGYRPPPGSQRQEYPADVDQWFREQYPWSCNFLGRDAVHTLLVVMIQGMENSRAYQRLNVYHWMTLYDVVHNTVRFYNDLLTFSPDRAGDLRLSQGVRVNFDDLVNNHWSRLDFMILSRPDYPHERLLAANQPIEQAIQERVQEGEPPPVALEKIVARFQLDPATLACLRHDPISENLLQLVPVPVEEQPYACLSEMSDDDSGVSRTDREYSLNYQLFRKSKTHAPA